MARSRPITPPPNPADRSAPCWPTSCSRHPGWSCWLLPPALLVVNLLLVRARPPTGSVPRSVSLVLLVAAGSIHKLAPTLRPSPPVGSGGYLGALIALFLAAISARRPAPDPGVRLGLRAGALPRCPDRLAGPGRSSAGSGAGSAATGPASDQATAAGREGSGPDWAAVPNRPAETLPAPPGLPARPPLITVRDPGCRRLRGGSALPGRTRHRLPARPRHPARRPGSPFDCHRWSCSSLPRPSRSRSTRPRSMLGRCSWSGPSWISATRSASCRSIPARSSPSSRSSWRPACACRRSSAWPTTWRSPWPCRASASSRRYPAGRPSASRCPTTIATWSGWAT